MKKTMLFVLMTLYVISMTACQKSDKNESNASGGVEGGGPVMETPDAEVMTTDYPGSGRYNIGPIEQEVYLEYNKKTMYYNVYVLL